MLRKTKRGEAVIIPRRSTDPSSRGLSAEQMVYSIPTIKDWLCARRFSVVAGPLARVRGAPRGSTNVIVACVTTMVARGALWLEEGPPKDPAKVVRKEKVRARKDIDGLGWRCPRLRRFAVGGPPAWLIQII